MVSRTKRPTCAGLAYSNKVNDDPTSQAALQRVRGSLEAFGRAYCQTAGTVDAARRAVTAAIRDPMRGHQQFVAAMSEALGDGRFDDLHSLVECHPELQPACVESEQAALACQRIRQERRCELENWSPTRRPALRESWFTTPPAFADPQTWSSIIPVGEQIKNALHDAKQEHFGRGRRKTSVADVAAGLEQYRASGGAYLDQRTLSRLLGCRPSTVNKAIRQSAGLRAWKDAALRASKRQAAPRRATGDFDILLKQLPARPTEPMTADDTEAILKKLSKQVAGCPEFLEKLKDMTPEERSSIARLYADGDYEPSPLEADPPGSPRKTKYHRRV